MLLDSFRFQRVLKNELHEDHSAGLSSSLGDIRDHHFFDRLHKVIEICTEELPVDDRLQALEDMGLTREVIQVALDDENEGLDLSFR